MKTLLATLSLILIATLSHADCGPTMDFDIDRDVIDNDTEFSIGLSIPLGRENCAKERADAAKAQDEALRARHQAAKAQADAMSQQIDNLLAIVELCAGDNPIESLCSRLEDLGATVKLK